MTLIRRDIQIQHKKHRWLPSLEGRHGSGWLLGRKKQDDVVQPIPIVDSKRWLPSMESKRIPAWLVGRKKEEILLPEPLIEKKRSFFPATTQTGIVSNSIIWVQTVDCRLISNLAWLKRRREDYPPPEPVEERRKFHHAPGVYLESISQTDPIVQTLISNFVFNRSLTSNWSPTTSVLNPQEHASTFHHGLGFNQHTKVQRVITLTASNHLHQHNHWFVAPRSLSSTYNPVGTVVYSRVWNRNLSSLYQLSQATVKKNALGFSVSNQLSFLPYRTIYVPLGSVGNHKAPSLLVTTIPAPNYGPSSYVWTGTTFHAIGQSPIRNFPYVTLQVPQLGIILPAPEFDDSQAYSGMFNIRRSMNGATYTYIHRLNTSKLKYDFVIGIPKSYELENYLLNYNSMVHTMTNWKGEIWIVFITNNPMEMISKQRWTNDRGDSYDDREKVTVTLEFEGTRIH